MSALNTTIIFFGVFLLVFGAVYLLPRSVERYLPHAGLCTMLLTGVFALAVSYQEPMVATEASDHSPRPVTAERPARDPEEVMYSI